MSNERDRSQSHSALLRSKLRRPAVPDYYVVRARLDDALDAAAERSLTLVVAPAGSGKTQLLSHWVSATRRPSSWLSLEEVDDDPIALWRGVVAALETLAPGCGHAAEHAMGLRADVDDVVDALLEGLDAASATDGVLIVDDIHHVTDPRSAAAFARFVQHVPSWLHLVVAGRVDPPIPLDRLRVRGRLTELRFDELRLTVGEAGEMLARLAPDLSEEERDRSIGETDGWAAGVQLVGLAARTARVRGVAAGAGPGARVLTEDFVTHEVLATGGPDVIDLLQQVSVVDRVNTRLAIAVTGRSDAHELLLRGEAEGLFVFRLGTEDWFRIHPLVREQLYAELVRRGDHQRCHARAARWLEDAGETVSALDQWLAAGCHRDALRLLAARSTELYDDGREAVIARTLAAVPPGAAMADLSSMVDDAVSRILGPLPRFVATVRDVVWRADAAGRPQPASVETLHAIALTMSGDWTAGEVAARQAIADLGPDWWLDPAARFAWNTAARGVALSERWSDDDDFVRAATMAMRRDPRRGISLEGIRALGHALAGRPVDALRVAAGVRHAAPAMSILRIELALAEAAARLEIGDLERALVDLRAVADERDEPRLFAPVLARVTLAEGAAERGDLDGALADLTVAEGLIATVPGGPDLAERAHRAAVEIALAADDLDTADDRADAITDTFWGPLERARTALARGDRAAAGDALAAAVARGPRHEVALGLTRARATRTPDARVAAVTAAVVLASTHDLLQTVVTFGRDLADVVERTAWRVPSEWLHRVRLALTPPGLPPQLAARDFPEQLTERERDVLRLLPSRLTVSEIAKELYVSVNTVKFHLRIIYRKLGVNSRAEAAAIARTMSTMSRSPS